MGVWLKLYASKDSSRTIFIVAILFFSLVSGIFGLQSFQVTVPSSGVIDYRSVLRDDFVINGSWWELDTVYSYMYNLSVAFPTFVRREWIGVSYNTYDIYALIIGLGSKYMVMDACIHGNEKTATFGALEFANFLIRNWNDSYWNSRLHEITVVMVPVLNPDGFVKNSYEFDPPDGGGCNGNGKNLNRQFPPGANTTEPEALAYLDLWSRYPPSVLVSHHTGELNKVYWSQYMDSWDDILVKDALQVANQSFVMNDHTETAGDGSWLGKIHTFSQAGYDSMTVAGAGYLYGAVAVLTEFWRPYTKYADAGIDYFLQVSIAMLSHIDNTVQTRTTYSSIGLVEVTEATADVTIALASDISPIPADVTITRIYSSTDPSSVRVDGIALPRGSWSYDSTAKIVTVENAREEIVLVLE